MAISARIIAVRVLMSFIVNSTPCFISNKYFGYAIGYAYRTQPSGISFCPLSVSAEIYGLFCSIVFGLNYLVFIDGKTNRFHLKFLPLNGPILQSSQPKRYCRQGLYIHISCRVASLRILPLYPCSRFSARLSRQGHQNKSSC